MYIYILCNSIGNNKIEPEKEKANSGKICRRESPVEIWRNPIIGGSVFIEASRTMTRKRLRIAGPQRVVCNGSKFGCCWKNLFLNRQEKKRGQLKRPTEIVSGRLNACPHHHFVFWKWGPDQEKKRVNRRTLWIFSDNGGNQESVTRWIVNSYYHLKSLCRRHRHHQDRLPLWEGWTRFCFFPQIFRNFSDRMSAVKRP